MVDITEIYGPIYGPRRRGRFLNTAVAEELGLWQTSLKIESAEVQELNGKKKLVLQLSNGKESYLLPLNRTNALILADSFGSNTDAWLGKQIMLVKVKRNFQGKLVDAIQVVSAEAREAKKAKK